MDFELGDDQRAFQAAARDFAASEMAPYAVGQDRPVDVLFVGGYSQHHQQRAAVLEAVARMAGEYNVVYHLDRSRLCRLDLRGSRWRSTVPA